jgi:hypothetical protein
MNDYYTYAYLREDGSPYYIGKGRGRRAIIPHYGCKVNRPQTKDRILYLKKNLTEEEAFNHEKYMIYVLGRKDLGTGILRNGTDGGDGASGYKHTEEHKNYISNLFKGRPKTHGSGRQKGIPLEELTRQKISDTLKGRPCPQNDTKGRVWVNDGTKSFMIHPPIPLHLQKGRINPDRNQGLSHSKKMSGRVWVNDGTNSFMIHPPIPPHLNKGRV